MLQLLCAAPELCQLVLHVLQGLIQLELVKLLLLPLVMLTAAAAAADGGRVVHPGEGVGCAEAALEPG